MAESDGWLIALTEVSKAVMPGAERTSTVTITRDPARICAAQGR